MANVKKALYNVAVFLVSLFITGSINVSNIKNTQDTSRVTLTVNETETLQEMNGWGSAAAWWAQVAGGSKNADDIAKLLYSKEGLGLNIYRYNVGSGEKQNPNSRLDPDSWKSTASFLVYNEKTGKYEYDWSQDANAMNMLKLCMSYGCIDSVVLFSNSPHFSMTVSGQASGGLKKHQNNLKPECYQEYVDYFLDITEHFLELGVPVKYISPINEPLVSWGGDNVYQEGRHYDEKEMFKLYRMFAKSIKERGLNVKMSMCEVSKIGNPAFEYIKKISKDEELSSVMATYSYHSYWSDTNYLLKKAWGQYLRRYYPDVTVEMDEWCELPCHSTTRSISGARTMARTICQDIMYSNATAWTSWVAVSEWGDNSDGLIIADHECNEYYTAKRYNALAHFSKFVPVGSKVISNEKDVNDRVAWKIKNQMGFVILNKTNCASFLTPDGSIVVVIVNDDAGCTFNFEGISGRDNLKIYTTNDQYDLKLTYDGEYKQEVEIPGLSITTLIFS